MAKRNFVSATGLIVTAFVGVAVGYLLRSPHNQPRTAEAGAGSQHNPVQIRGEALARNVCATCHLFPVPDLLTRRQWSHHIMPQMALWMGVEPVNYESLPEGKLLENTTLYPKAPLINEDDWFAIWEYYETAAPDKPVPPAAKPAVREGLPGFAARKINLNEGTPMVSLLRIDSVQGGMLVGDGFAGVLAVMAADGTKIHSIDLGDAPVCLTTARDGAYATLIGRVYPSDQLEGKVVFLPPDPNQKARPAIPALRRPVHTSAADLDGDGLEDLVVCAFGNRLGRVSWFRGQPGGMFIEHVLLDRPGAVQAEIRDFDGDGKLDIMVLMAQAREGIYLFFNQGDGRFRMETVLEEHPLFGFASLQLVDFNGDGQLDLLTANGDNGDNPTSHKRYHGVRIYLNYGRAKYRQAYFYPMEGAYKAVAADFDADGDLDIGAISFFPEFGDPAMESFVYLKNQGQLAFEPGTVPERRLGRWMVMDAGDVDTDGDEDIVLGSFVLGPTTIPVPLAVREAWRTNGAALLVLENSLKKLGRTAPAP